MSAEELERRAVQAARDRYGRAAVEYNALVVSLSAYENSAAALAAQASGDSAEIAAAAEKTEAAIEILRKRLADHRVKAALAAIPRVTIQLDGASMESDRPAPNSGRDAPETTGDIVSVADAMVAAMVGETGLEAPPSLMRKLAGVRAASGDRQQRLAFDDLRLAVQRVRDAHRARMQRERQQNQVLSALDGCGGLEATRMREAVRAVAPDMDLPVTVEQARQIAARDLAERDAEFVQNAVAGVLYELGYAVGTKMSVTVAHDGALLELPRHPGHGARLRARGGQLQFYVVRLGEAGDPVVDADAEVEACQVFAEVHEKLESAGVQWHLQRKDPPGAVPVAHQSTRPDSLIRRRERPKRRRRGTSEREIPG